MKEFCPEWENAIKEAEKGGFTLEPVCPIAKYCEGECTLNKTVDEVKGSDKPDHVARSLASQPNHKKHWKKEDLGEEYKDAMYEGFQDLNLGC